MAKSRARLIGAAAALTAVAVLGAPAVSGATEASAVKAQDAYGLIEFNGPNGDAAAENCAERTSPNGGRAYICSSYELENGYTDGYYRGTVYGATYVQVRIDRDNDLVSNVTTRPNFRGIWILKQSVEFRACIATTCGGWS